jgi:hypothetical protein
VTHVTLTDAQPSFNRSWVERNPATYRTGDMLFTAIITTLIVVGALGYATRSGSSGELIAHRPYNNRYNDASGAREDHV